MAMLFAAVHESGCGGTKRTKRAGLTMSAVRGRPEVAFRGREDRFWTRNGRQRMYETAWY